MEIKKNFIDGVNVTIGEITKIAKENKMSLRDFIVLVIDKCERDTDIRNYYKTQIINPETFLKVEESERKRTIVSEKNKQS